MVTDIDAPIMTPPPFLLFWEEYQEKILLGVALLVVIFVLVGGALLWKRSERLAAAALFSNAKTIPEWQAVVQRYPRSEAAANALLLIAGTQAQEHQNEASNGTYSQFLEKFPHAPLAVSALLGRGMNDDALGHADQALNEFQQAASTYPKTYGAPIALFMKARILMRLHKKEEAKQVLEVISSQYPESLVSTVMLKYEAPALK